MARQKRDKCNLQEENIDLKEVPCLLYLHSQGGCRLQGKNMAYYCGEKAYACCLMDFEGSGMSSGEYVSLGYFEKAQVEIVIDYLTEHYHIGMIALWGRSMGAVTALLYAEHNAFRVGAIVVDSPFSSLTKMVQDIAYEHYKIPGFIASIGISVITSSIKDRLGVDLFEKLDAYTSVQKCTTPIVFVAASDDCLVRPKRINQLFKIYGSSNEDPVKKQYLECSGGHTDERPIDIIDTCFSFIEKELDAYIVTKLKLDRHVFNMNKYIRIKGVNNATIPRKVIAMDKRGNIKVSQGINSAKMNQNNSQRNDQNPSTFNQDNTLRDTTNTVKNIEGIETAINVLKRSRLKNTHTNFQQATKENIRLQSSKPQPKILDSDIQIWPMQRNSRVNHNYSRPPLSPPTAKETPLIWQPENIVGLKHSRTKSMTGFFTNLEIGSPVVSAPSFLGQAKGSTNMVNGHHAQYSRQNSTTKLYAEGDGKCSENVSRDQSVNDSRRFTPIKAKVDDYTDLQASCSKISSYNKSARKLQTICKQPSLLGYPGFKNPTYRQASFEAEYHSSSFRFDPNPHDQSDWNMFGFDSKQNISREQSRIEEPRPKPQSLRSQVGHFGF